MIYAGSPSMKLKECSVFSTLKLHAYSRTLALAFLRKLKIKMNKIKNKQTNKQTKRNSKIGMYLKIRRREQGVGGEGINDLYFDNLL